MLPLTDTVRDRSGSSCGDRLRTRPPLRRQSDRAIGGVRTMEAIVPRSALSVLCSAEPRSLRATGLSTAPRRSEERAAPLRLKRSRLRRGCFDRRAGVSTTARVRMPVGERERAVPAEVRCGRYESPRPVGRPTGQDKREPDAVGVGPRRATGFMRLRKRCPMSLTSAIAGRLPVRAADPGIATAVLVVQATSPRRWRCPSRSLRSSLKPALREGAGLCEHRNGWN